MKLVAYQQGSPEWLAWRRSGIGASESATVIGANPYEKPLKLWKQKRGLVKEFGGNAHTERGHRLEPIARDLYEQLMGIRMTPVCVIHDDYPWLKASLDGLSDTYDTVLEIKAPAATNHGEVLAGRIPIYWQVQMQHQLLVTGASTVHFVLYNEDFPPAEQFVLRVVQANPKFQAKLLPALQRFWTAVETGEPLEEWTAA